MIFSHSPQFVALRKDSLETFLHIVGKGIIQCIRVWIFVDFIDTINCGLARLCDGVVWVHQHIDTLLGRGKSIRIHICSMFLLLLSFYMWRRHWSATWWAVWCPWRANPTPMTSSPSYVKCWPAKGDWLIPSLPVAIFNGDFHRLFSVSAFERGWADICLRKSTGTCEASTVMFRAMITNCRAIWSQSLGTWRVWGPPCEHCARAVVGLLTRIY